MLPIRKCGSQGFECAAQGLGCMSMSFAYGEFKSEEAQAECPRVFDAAASHKDLMLDTSDMYGPFTNEELIGQAIKDRKGTFKIASKCGIIVGAEHFSYNSSPEHVKAACQASLNRLGVDRIDLYYLHRYNPETLVEETFRAFKQLVEEDKIKYVGVSELSVANIRKAHAICPITACQLEWSLFTRDAEKELIPTCRELGIGIVAYSPLGRGYLTGTITSKDDLPSDDHRHSFPQFNEHMDENLKLVEVVKEIAASKGCTPGQVALAWVHAQGDDVFPIPGTKRVSRFEENVEAFNVKLTEEEMERLNGIGEKVQGTRYSAIGMTATFDGSIQSQSQ